jgi:hypothetical protein
MPSNIGSVQKSTIGSGFLDSVGEGKDEFTFVNTVFEEYGKQFLLNLSKSANDKKVVASGNLLSQTKFEVEGNVMRIIVPDYYDFPNEGVRGVKSSKNAPTSPYKYKTYGMSDEGRASIRQYIQSGRAKISTVTKTKDKALGIGLEKKKLSLIDAQTNQLVYLIKRFGIKKTNYFTDALNATFGKDFELKMSEAFGKQIVFTLEKLNRK